MSLAPFRRTLRVATWAQARWSNGATSFRLLSGSFTLSDESLTGAIQQLSLSPLKRARSIRFCNGCIHLAITRHSHDFSNTITVLGCQDFIITNFVPTG